MNFEFRALSSQNENLHPINALSYCDEATSICSISDDGAMKKWDAGKCTNHRGTENLSAEMSHFESVGTCMDWLPNFAQRNPKLLVVGFSDGSLRYFDGEMKPIEKIEAHEGATIKVKFCNDGSALCSCGEDGFVKVWSKSGSFRTNLYQSSASIYAFSCSPDNEKIVVGDESSIVLLPLQGGKKRETISAHKGKITCLSWNKKNGLIASGSEDKTFAIFDETLQQIFRVSDKCLKFQVTSLEWSKNGEYLAVGSFEIVSVFDKFGLLIRSESLVRKGSVFAIDWANDSKQFAFGCGNGQIFIADSVGKKIAKGKFEAYLESRNKIVLTDFSDNSVENLDFDDDRIIDIDLSDKYLFVLTVFKCSIYFNENPSTPHIIDFKGHNLGLILSQNLLATVNHLSGIQFWSFEGSLISSIGMSGTRLELLAFDDVAVSDEMLAIVDCSNEKIVNFYHTKSGDIVSNLEVSHRVEIKSIGLSEMGNGSEDKHLALIDKSCDFWLYNLSNSTKFEERCAECFKLGVQVRAFKWSEKSGILVCLGAENLSIFYFPEAAFIDAELFSDCTEKRKFSGSSAGSKVSFVGDKVEVKVNGRIERVFFISPLSSSLQENFGKKRFERCLEICRLSNDLKIWTVLAALSIKNRKIDLSIEAFAMTKSADKLDFFKKLRKIAGKEERNSEYAFFRNKTKEAEDILLQSSPPLVHRALKLNIRQFKWARALELAVRYDTHIDTVVAYRRRHMELTKGKERDENFIKYGENVNVDWRAVLGKEGDERGDGMLLDG